MKLQAITVCVHGADLLSCSLSNRRHFDRWLIVTVSRDTETIALCRDNELECVTTEILRPDGADLHDGDNLAQVTAEAVARLDQDGWVVLLSEQVLLPRTFRTQMLSANLDSGCEYRLAGVRHCSNRFVFERMATLEPWRATPTKAFDDGPPLRMFARSEASPSARIAHLPLTALTVSDGRSSSSGAGMPDPRASLMDWLAAHGQRGTRCAMVAGSCPDFDLERFGRPFKAVYLAGDRTVAPDSIDVLYLPGEVSSEILVRCMPLWRRALHPNAVVCGDLYGMAEWPEATAIIAQLFGRPRIEPAGFWWTTVKDTALRSILGTAAGANGSDSSDAIQLTVNDASADDVLLSLYSLRKAWRGTIHVTATRPDPTLELQCALLGGAWHMSVPRLDGEPRSAISAGTLAFGTIAHSHTPHCVGRRPRLRIIPSAPAATVGIGTTAGIACTLSGRPSTLDEKRQNSAQQDGGGHVPRAPSRDPHASRQHRGDHRRSLHIPCFQGAMATLDIRQHAHHRRSRRPRSGGAR